MDGYIIPIKTAILVFIGLINVISIITLIIQYRKKGALTFFKAVIIYSFIFYLITAFFMTLLPLPKREYVATLSGPYGQFIPFMFIKDIIEKSTLVVFNPITYFNALTQPVVLQVIFNVVLIIPFGVYLRYYFKKDLKQVILLSFLMSLFYEITQITGVYGIYSRPYRLFDVDDLMLNTVGGIIGYFITPFLVFMFPSRSEIEEKVKKEADKVPFFRRLIAYIIDYYLFYFLIKVITFKISLNNYLLQFLIALALGVSYYVSNGKTLGLKFMRLKIVSTKNNKLNLIQSLIRSLTFALVYNLVFKVSLDFFNYLNNSNFEYPYIFAFYIILMLSVQLVLITHMIYSAIIKRIPMFYEKLSKSVVKSDL